MSETYLIIFLSILNICLLVGIVVYLRSRPKIQYSVKIDRRIGFIFKRDYLLLTKQEFAAGRLVGEPIKVVEISAKIIDENRAQQVIRTVENAAKSGLIDVASRFIGG